MKKLLSILLCMVISIGFIDIIPSQPQSDDDENYSISLFDTRPDKVNEDN